MTKTQSPLDEEEDTADKLRAILSQFDFASTVWSWDDRGVPFCTRLYVPEEHPITRSVFHEREDEGHVFKVQYMYSKCILSMALQTVHVACRELGSVQGEETLTN